MQPPQPSGAWQDSAASAGQQAAGDESDLYRRHRDRLLAASVPPAALVTLVLSLVYNGIAVARLKSIDGTLATMMLLQVAVPALVYALARGPLRHRATWTAVAADALFATAIVGRLLTPSGSVSGVALFLSVKMLTTALFFPWSNRAQQASAGLAVPLYYILLAWSGRWPELTGDGIHQLLGPLVAAILSSAGAAGAERMRRALFEREREARREARVASSLARVGEALIGCSDETSLADQLCQVTTDVLECDCSHTLLWNAAEEAFVVAGAYGYPAAQREAIRVVKVRRAGLEAGLASMECHGLVQGSLSEMPDPAWRNLAQEMGLTIGLGVVLRRGDELLGFHAACLRGRETPFSEAQLRVARGMARIATLALENVRLVERLAAANRVKSEFVAAISHELRSPINVILGYTGLLRDGSFGPLSAEQGDCIERLERSGRELHELITSTLDLSRIEAGTLRLEVRDMSVEDLIFEIDEEIGELKDKDGLCFSWQLAEGLPQLSTDPQKLKVVLKNLILNAIKFTEQGSVSVEVRARDEGVEFVVVDTGVGIPREALSRIFEAFHQEGGTSRHGGVGLGLYIVRRLVALLGGTIAVESEVGIGSTFRVSLPNRIEERESSPGRHAAAEPPSLPRLN